MGRAMSECRTPGAPVKRPSLTLWIFIALVAGVVFGTLFPGPARQMALLGAIFLRLIKSIIAPLIFATLVTGIASTGSLKVMGRIGLKAIVYFEIVTTIALAVGLGAANLVRPGEGIALNAPPLPRGNRGRRRQFARHGGARVSRERHRCDGARRRAAKSWCSRCYSARRARRSARRRSRCWTFANRSRRSCSAIRIT